MEKLKLILGLILLPFAFVIWVVDRIIYSLLPNDDHKKFNEWIKTSTVVFATVRVVLIVIFRWLFYLFFGI